MKNQLQLIKAFVRYPDQDGLLRTILNGIDLQASPGEFISVVGPTGCGKSTMLRLVLGSEQPFSGEVLMDDQPITGSDRHRGIVFQKA